MLWSISELLIDIGFGCVIGLVIGLVIGYFAPKFWPTKQIDIFDISGIISRLDAGILELSANKKESVIFDVRCEDFRFAVTTDKAGWIGSHSDHCGLVQSDGNELCVKISDKQIKELMAARSKYCSDKARVLLENIDILATKSAVKKLDEGRK